MPVLSSTMTNWTCHLLNLRDTRTVKLIPYNYTRSVRLDLSMGESPPQIGRKMPYLSHSSIYLCLYPCIYRWFFSLISFQNALKCQATRLEDTSIKTCMHLCSSILTHWCLWFTSVYLADIYWLKYWIHDFLYLLHILHEIHSIGRSSLVQPLQ